ncbi:MAG: metallophosphoesterase [Caldilineaceae bacterium]|nr:metallophosphoesterase [Caldilineaceae bacterium]
MKVAILSDSHDNIWNLEKALVDVDTQGCEVLLHCGDLVAPFILAQIAQAFDGPIHVVEGNNDGDGRLQQQVASGFPQISLHGPYAELELGGRKVALIHYPEPARRIAQSGSFDLVCYGHDHLHHWERIGNCLLVNPGELMGRYGSPSWGIYDCECHEFSLQAI